MTHWRTASMQGSRRLEIPDHHRHHHTYIRLYAILSLVGLIGCASPEEIASADCRSYGLTPGTEAYVSCVMQDVRGPSSTIGNYPGVFEPQVSMPPVPQAGAAGQQLLSLAF